jgi:CDP-diacylglycerol--glycerol-3-phosphate 3-phosphatidyltransferase
MSASTIRQDILNLPNLLTMFRIVLIPVVMWLIYLGTPRSCMIAAILFTVAAITDYLDGYIARKRGLVSLTGKFLDPLADKLIVMATLVMLLYHGWIQSWLVVLVMGRETSITALRAIAATEGMVIAAGTGGKFKTAFQLVGVLALTIHYEYVCDWGVYRSTIAYHNIGVWLFGVSVIFSVTSAWEYFVGFIKNIDQAHSKTAA